MKERPEPLPMMAASKPRDCDISFTPGFSPVSNDDKKRKTVLTVSSLATTLRLLICGGYVGRMGKPLKRFPDLLRG